MRFKNEDTNWECVEYKKYRSIYKNWTIKNDKPTIIPKYWHWFVYNHLDKIIFWAGAAPSSKNKCPNWSQITKNDAIESLSIIYQTSSH